MRNVVLGIALSLSITSVVSAAEQVAAGNNLAVNCSDFSALLASEASNQSPNMISVVTQLATSCPTVIDQIVETAISLTPEAQHQQIMQAVADTGLLSPTDILLAAIAGGGNPATLSEPTAGGNLTIVPASAATAPPVIGGRNGGTGEANAASNN